MSAWLIDGRWIDAVLALIVLESGALAAWLAWARRGPRTIPLIANLAAGGFLLLAARLTSAQASTAAIAGALAVALAAHLYDLVDRWRSARLSTDADAASGAVSRRQSMLASE